MNARWVKLANTPGLGSAAGSENWVACSDNGMGNDGGSVGRDAVSELATFQNYDALWRALEAYQHETATFRSALHKIILEQPRAYVGKMDQYGTLTDITPREYARTFERPSKGCSNAAERLPASMDWRCCEALPTLAGRAGGRRKSAHSAADHSRRLPVRERMAHSRHRAGHGDRLVRGIPFRPIRTVHRTAAGNGASTAHTVVTVTTQ